MDGKRKLIDLDKDSIIKLTTLAIKDNTDLKNFCQKVLKEVAVTKVFDSSIIKQVKLLIVDTDRCSCISPDVCELCNQNSAYNKLKQKLITLLNEN